MGAKLSSDEDDDSHDRESRREPSRRFHTNWLGVINLTTQIVVLVGSLADVLSRL